MPYYKGDYYRGDNYYTGDFLGIGKALKSVAKFAFNTIVPAPIRAVAQGVAGVIRGGSAAAPFILPPGPRLPSVGMVPVQQAGLVNVAPPFTPQTGLINITSGGGGGGTMTGVTASGRRRRFCAKNIGGQAVLVPCARRMNVTNVKALRRAGRRVKGFLKLARRLGALPVSSSGKKLFKKKRATK